MLCTGVPPRQRSQEDTYDKHGEKAYIGLRSVLWGLAAHVVFLAFTAPVIARAYSLEALLFAWCHHAFYRVITSLTWEY